MQHKINGFSMSPEQPNTSIHLLREIFLEALEKSDSTARAAFLDEACGGRAELGQRVEDLLQEEASLGSFLERPAWRIAKRTDSS
jgi:hypothetical protein